MKIYRNPGYWLKNILVSYSLLESSFLYFYMLPKYVHIYTFQPISNITRLSFYFPTPHPPKTQTLVLYDLSSSEWFIKATHITNQPKHFHVFFLLEMWIHFQGHVVRRSNGVAAWYQWNQFARHISQSLWIYTPIYVHWQDEPPWSKGEIRMKFKQCWLLFYTFVLSQLNLNLLFK